MKNRFYILTFKGTTLEKLQAQLDHELIMLQDDGNEIIDCQILQDPQNCRMLIGIIKYKYINE
jgi:hypothetical protein